MSERRALPHDGIHDPEGKMSFQLRCNSKRTTRIFQLGTEVEGLLFPEQQQASLGEPQCDVSQVY